MGSLPLFGYPTQLKAIHFPGNKPAKPFATRLTVDKIPPGATDLDPNDGYVFATIQGVVTVWSSTVDPSAFPPQKLVNKQKVGSIFTFGTTDVNVSVGSIVDNGNLTFLAHNNFLWTFQLVHPITGAVVAEATAQVANVIGGRINDATDRAEFTPPNPGIARFTLSLPMQYLIMPVPKH